MGFDNLEVTAGDEATRAFSDHADAAENLPDAEENPPSGVIAEDVSAASAQHLHSSVNEQGRVDEILLQCPRPLSAFLKVLELFSNFGLDNECHNKAVPKFTNKFLARFERLKLPSNITLDQCLRFFFQVVTIPGFWKRINAKAKFSNDLGCLYHAASYFVLFFPSDEVQEFFLEDIKEWSILLSIICCMLNGQNFSFVTEKFFSTFGDDLPSGFWTAISFKRDMIQQFLATVTAEHPEENFYVHCDELLKMNNRAVSRCWCQRCSL